MSKPYLIAYNVACCAAWSYVLFLAVTNVCPVHLKDSLANVYAIPNLAPVLTYVQCAAMLEIVHAAIGLVRSPVVVTAMQVSSRIFAIIAITNSTDAQTQWGAGVMIISWALVEVVRYAFYASALMQKKVPYTLFWLRYSLFGILYPSGISGELSVFFAAANDPHFLGLLGSGNENLVYYLVMALPVIYAPGSPVMIMNMVGNRKSAFKKRFARPPPPPLGLVWPKTVGKNGKEDRSSTSTAKAVLAAAIGAVNKEKGEAILKLKNWRFGYVKHFMGMVEEQCKSPEAALAVAKAGLEKAYEIFEFVSPDGTTCSFAEAMAANNNDKFYTGFVKGEKPKGDNKIVVPYKGKDLSGEELKAQVKKWVDYGTIEDSAGNAIIKCIDNPGWLDLSDRYFVLLGAGSAMGPFLVLMAMGANVVAIDLDRPFIWKRLINIAKKSSGSITFPMKVEQASCADEDALYAAAGCNLFTHTPIIKDWLVGLYRGKPFTVGSYAYLNGALHVQVSLAMDAICKELTEKRPGTSLAYLCTPTDIHLVPEEVNKASLEHYNRFDIIKIYATIMNKLTGGKYCVKNALKPFVANDGKKFYVVDGMTVAQGPNYALAKRMQHWRAIIAHSMGCKVSSNVAPSTSTVSVVQNRTFAWAYEGIPHFKPHEVATPDVSNNVMSAILFYDLNDDESVANPKNPLDNPNSLFSYGSFNGGCWRCAYKMNSIGEASVLIYFGKLAMPYVITGLAVIPTLISKFM